MDTGNKRHCKAAFLLLLICTSVQSVGQDYLYPCVIESKIIEIKSYNEKLAEVLQSRLRSDYIVRFLAKPTVDPEYTFQINETNTSKYAIEALSLTTNLWNTKNADSLLIYNTTVSKSLGEAIILMFHKLTSSISKDAVGRGLDGISYTFLDNSVGEIRCGETWSPKENSVLGEIIKVCNDLVKCAKGADPEDLDLLERIMAINRNIP